MVLIGAPLQTKDNNKYNNKDNNQDHDKDNNNKDR